MKGIISIAVLILLTATLFSCGEQLPISGNTDFLPIEEPSASVMLEFSPDGADIVSTYAQCDFLDLDNSADLSEHVPEYVMLHFSSAVMTSPENPYDMNAVREIFEKNEVGTHYIIDRDGTIICYVPEQYDAWHAGRGVFADNEKYTNKMNNYAIGIELVGIGSQSDMSTYLTPYEYRKYTDIAGFTDEQYSSLNLLINDICKRYDIPRNRSHIIGHEEYSKTKSDPGELFDWNRII